jgi:hypothetical protein
MNIISFFGIQHKDTSSSITINIRMLAKAMLLEGVERTQSYGATIVQTPISIQSPSEPDKPQEESSTKEPKAEKPREDQPRTPLDAVTLMPLS